MLVDSHCHLDLLDLANNNDLNQVIARAKVNNVHYFLNVGVTLKDFPRVLEIAEAYPFVGASVGLHPSEEEGTIDKTLFTSLLAYGAHHKVIAVGETGLDYYYAKGDLTWQQDRFRTHIAAAKTLQKPLIIHTRQAKADTLRIMQEEKADEIGGVMHCFTEDWDFAEQALALNFYISLSGIVTFKNAIIIQEVAKRVPLDRLLIETDAPYLAPVPMRGKPNEPAYVKYTAEYIAHLRNIPVEVVAQQTTDNFFQLFKRAIKPHV